MKKILFIIFAVFIFSSAFVSSPEAKTTEAQQTPCIQVSVFIAVSNGDGTMTVYATWTPENGKNKYLKVSPLDGEPVTVPASAGYLQEEMPFSNTVTLEAFVGNGGSACFTRTIVIN